MEKDYKSDNNVVLPDHTALQYSGRIDFTNSLEPTFIYPYSGIKTVFTGTKLDVIVRNHRDCWDNRLGFVIDGVQDCVLLPYDNTIIRLNLVKKLEDKEHTLFFFKRQDACHYFDFLGFVLSETGELKQPEERSSRRIEVYGDSVSAGEVAEAEDYIGKPDPEHNGEYSNAYYSYAAFLARKLNAELHDIAQGGIALLDGTGYVAPPKYVGMESRYDKLRYLPALGAVNMWDFTRYSPHIVIVAIGQNDNFPEDYMAIDYNGEKAKYWRKKYKELVLHIREKYPNAFIILKTTILEHNGNWDKAIDEVCEDINDGRIEHFLYSNNGCGTPGHIRISEAEKMAEELGAYIEKFGDTIWQVKSISV